ncbi:MAG: hypothetical protein HN380_21570, partial [Victivallales bacterium]|nr:hypothetical protein [Victivallales bacterium]
IDTDFGAAAAPAMDAVSRQPSKVLDGVMADGWPENSSNWAKVRGTSTVIEEEGERFLRVTVTEREKGWMQFRHDLAGVKGMARYVLTVRLRNLSADSVQLGLRLRGLPYTFHWQVKEKFSPEWRTRRFEFSLPKLKREVGFWVMIHGTGTVDLGHLKLERIEGKKDVVARLKQEYPDGGPGNIVRNSRFPLGLPTGWRLGRDFSPNEKDDVMTVTDPDVIGPSGAPALRIEGTVLSLLCEPFVPVYPVVKHQASVAVRGSGTWWFVLRNGGEDIDRERVRLKGKAGWQRVRLTFKPEPAGGLYTLRIEGGGILWLDAMQVGPTSKAKEYQSPGECEVALGLPESDASIAGVQFGDESAVARYCVSGDGQGAVLKSKAVNAYGDEQELPDVPLTGGSFLTQGDLPYDVFPTRPYGGCRVEAWVERDGKRISPINEIVVHRLRRPRYWGKDAPDSPFGAHFNSRHERNLTMKAIGVNWVRLHDAGISYTGWHYLEPKKGTWEFRDDEIRRYRQDKIKIFAQLGTAPPWARKQKGKVSAYHDMYSQPQSLADWQTYVRTVTARYKGEIDTYFVWNEPWMYSRWNVGHSGKEGPQGYTTSADPQRDFAALMRAAHSAARQVDASIRVCGFSTADWKGGDGHTVSGPDWTAGVLENGGLDVCDLIDYHHYSDTLNGFAGDNAEQAWNAAMGPILRDRGSVPKPVWMSEGQGSMDTHRLGLYKHTAPGIDQEDLVAASDRLVRYELAVLAAGAQKLFLYSPFSDGFDGSNRYTVLVAGDKSLHPSAAAHSTLAWHLEDTVFTRRTEVARGVFAYLFNGAGRSVAVLSSAPQHDPYAIPSHPDVLALDLFGNPLAAGSQFFGTLVYLSTENRPDLLQKLLVKSAP